MLLLVGALAAMAAEHFEGRAFYAGDLHAHTGASADGGAADLGNCRSDCGSVAELAESAREAGLDFLAVTDHANGAMSAGPELWAAVQAALAEAHDPEGGLVVVPGAELWFTENGHALGHKNLYAFDDGLDLSRWTLDAVRFAGVDTEVADCEAIWEWAASLEDRLGPVLLLPHHPGMAGDMGTDWSCHEVAGAERLAPAVEVYSEHGNSLEVDADFDPLWNGYGRLTAVRWALDPDAFDLALGFVGGTDGHDTRPGAVCGTDGEHPEHPYGGGLTIAVLDETEVFDRSALYRAIVERRTYATSGPVIPVTLAFRSGGAELGTMGEVLAVPTGQPLEVELRVPADDAPYVDEVRLVGRDLDTAMVPEGEGRWTAVLPWAEQPPYLYADLAVDGAAWWGEAGIDCEDGGETDEEHVWLSPSWIEEGAPDLDGDGVSWADGDCDDGDPEVSPRAPEDCATPRDEDCDGAGGADDPDCAPEVSSDLLDDEEAPASETEAWGPDADGSPPPQDGGDARAPRGCATAPGGGLLALALALGGIARRRRR